MQDVDLARFRFDFDLTFSVLFVNSRGRVLGRFGTRDERGAEHRISQTGLENAMTRALEVYEQEKKQGPRARPRSPVTARTHPGAASLWQGKERPDCYHCHMVYDIERQPARVAGRWPKSEAYVFPLPENIGLSLAIDDGNLVEQVAGDSPAERAGLEPGDRLARLKDQPILSQADVQWVLQHARDGATLDVAYRRGGQEKTTRIRLPRGHQWRETKVWWRQSIWSIGISPKVHAMALASDRRRALGIPDDDLAIDIRYVPDGPGKTAGIRKGDILVAIEGRRDNRPWDEIRTEIRLKHDVGDRLVWTILRNGREQEVTIHLR